MKRIGTTGLAGLGVLAVLTACSSGTPEQSDLDRRQTEVAEAGALIMPFDLDRTTHVFEVTDFGGVQTVTTDDQDGEQERLIREHLRDEAERFSNGDFHHPEMIHGADMAGMHALVTGHEQLNITYRDVEGGGEIQYATEDAALVAAIHEWFEAQLSDHGDHAQPHR